MTRPFLWEMLEDYIARIVVHYRFLIGHVVLHVREPVTPVSRTNR